MSFLETSDVCGFFERDLVGDVLVNKLPYSAETPIVGEGSGVEVLFAEHCPFSTFATIGDRRRWDKDLVIIDHLSCLWRISTQAAIGR